MTVGDLFFLLAGVAVLVLVGVYARSRGRSGVGWALLALLITPLLALLALVLLPRVGRVTYDDLGDPITPATHVLCPDCKAPVRNNARKCRHCGAALVPQ